MISDAFRYLKERRALSGYLSVYNPVLFGYALKLKLNEQKKTNKLMLKILFLFSINKIMNILNHYVLYYLSQGLRQFHLHLAI